jgi:hypothetical protein
VNAVIPAYGYFDYPECRTLLHKEEELANGKLVIEQLGAMANAIKEVDVTTIFNLPEEFEVPKEFKMQVEHSLPEELNELAVELNLSEATKDLLQTDNLNQEFSNQVALLNAQTLGRIVDKMKQDQASVIVPVNIKHNSPSATEGTTNTLFHSNQIFVDSLQPSFAGLTAAENANSILLPMFNTPVRSTEDVLTTLAFGLNSLTVNSKGSNELQVMHNENWLETVTEPLLNCVGNDVRGSSKIVLDILGFASEQWEKELPDHQKVINNHALSEGRRLAVIKWLKERAKSDKNGFDARRVELASKGENINLAEISIEDLQNKWKEYQRFENGAAMFKRRDAWVGTVANKKDANPIHELLSRSVVIQILELNSPNCRLASVEMEVE